MRKCMLAATAVVLGASAVTLPAVAGSETSPTITAVNGTGVYSEQTHSWSPSRLAIGEGASVTLSNPTTVPHGVRWVATPATPVCSGVPAGTSEAASGAEWSGSCTFAQPGTYTFYCTVHGAAMSGTITVAAPSGEPPSGPPAPTTPTGPSIPGGQTPGFGPGQGPSTPGATGAPVGSPFAGGRGALKLRPAQRGSSVHGAVSVSAAGAGATLEVDLLAKAASLAGAGHNGAVRVGRLQRGSLTAGTVRFAVALNARGRHALARRGRLALTVEIVLSAPGGRAAKLERGVVLSRPAH